MHHVTRRVLAATGLALVFAASTALAQQPQTVRVRGQIEKVDGTTLTVKARDGSEMKLKLAEPPRINAMVKSSLADIKEGSFIGVSAMPQPDGTQKAFAIHIFLDAQRGVVADRFSEWDSRPGSTMTNANVATMVTGKDGRELLVKYKDGEKKVVVPEGTPIVTFVAGDKSELKPGAKIIIFGAVKKDDGTLEANRVNVGRDGITPPM
jgi:outer membrane lipoprotein SlyB